MGVPLSRRIGIRVFEVERLRVGGDLRVKGSQSSLII
jgi:hypothetical protein